MTNIVETKVKGWQQQYGYFEIRCKVPPKGKMFWPAFWLWGNDWPPEIDIFEFMAKEDVETGNSSEISMTLHWGQGNDVYHGQLGRKLKGVNWDENYHIYACKWEWDSVTFYIDNVAVYKNIYNVASNKMSILISNGASWDYIPQASDLPGIFYVDYVRAYQQT
jgi:beta-glucanase (GH16 family)